MKKRILLIIFGLLTLINVLVFLNRKHFEYRSYPPPGELYKACDDQCIAKWQRYVKDYPAEDILAVDRILDTVIPKTGAGNAERARIIADFLRKNFSDRKGVPSGELQSKTPAGQFSLLRNNQKEKIWCGNWSNIFAYFCWNRGIPTRIIEINKPGDHHVVNECYIPEDSCWGLVDLTNNIILPRDRNGNYHNLISYTGDSVSRGLENYSSLYPIHYYYRYDLKKIYSFGSRAKRYLTPDPWYETVDLHNPAPGNTLFYVKTGFFYLWVISGLLIVLFYFWQSNPFYGKSKSTGKENKESN